MLTDRRLLILKYLWEESDENHKVTVVDIQNHLEKLGQKRPGRATVYQDIEQLQAFGVRIEYERYVQNRYWIDTRLFSPAELRLLVDAVQAAKFISKKKSEALVDKLTVFAGSSGEEIKNRKLLIEARPKTDNENLLYIVNELQDAIRNRRKVNFQYCDYDPQKRKVLRHNGQVYSVSPYSMLWNGDNYYMIGYSDSHQDVVRFRVNRMENVSSVEEKAVRKPKGFKETDYYSQVFSMYDGPECEVDILCTNDLMNIMIDRFGKSVNTVVMDPKHFKVHTVVHLSDTFYGWICSLGGKARIIGPTDAVKGFNKLIESLSTPSES